MAFFDKKERPRQYLLAGLVAAAAFLVYLAALKNGFVWDDYLYISQNPHIRSFGPAFLKWAFWGFHNASAGNWLPVTWISYALDSAVWGANNPLGYHLTNIILHSANTFLVVLLAIRLIEAWEEVERQSGVEPLAGQSNFGAPFRTLFPEGRGKEKLIAGAVAGLLFGLHPLHVESVAWAAERKDLLCSLFFLLSLLAYVKYAGHLRMGYNGARRFYSWRYLLALGLFALALMSKPMAVSLPLVLLALDWHPLDRISSFRSFLSAFYEKLPFVVLSALASVLALQAQKKGAAMTAFKQIPLFERLLVAARSLVLYLWKMVFPLDLVPFYPYPKNVSIWSARYFLPIVLIIALVSFCLFAAKKKRLWLACLGYYVITVLPVLGIIQVGRQAMADRYTYLPSLGPFLAVGITAAWVWRKTDFLKAGKKTMKTGLALAALSAVFSMSYLTGAQIDVWKSNRVLWSYVIKKEPGKVPFAYYNRGLAFAAAGQPRRAVADYDAAVALDPGYADAYNNRGVEFGKEGQLGRAISDFSKAVALRPAFYQAWYNLGKAFEETGRFGLAIEKFDRAIALHPSYADAYNELGIALEALKHPGLALGAFDKSILLGPHNAAAYADRAELYLETGRKRLAASDLRKACEMGDGDCCRALRTP